MATLAYSYIRLSSDRQAFGDSVRRQRERAEAFAAEHGLVLDTSLRDIGVSAWKGKNRLRGALSGFLKAVDEGRIAKGSYLLVESLDRLSRENVIEAQSLFLDIIRRDIVVAVLNRGFPQVFSRDRLTDNPWELFGALNGMILANQESVQKGMRVRAAWEAKKRNAADTPVSNHSPRWLEWNAATGQWDVIEERAKIVRQVFEWTADGIGRAEIVKRLNAAKVPTFGAAKTGWAHSVLYYWLSTPVAIGTYQPHKIVWGDDGIRRREPDGEPIEGYYPAIVGHDLYQRARAALSSRATGVGRKGTRYANLFAGVAFCETCRGRMAFQNKGGRDKPRLICEARQRGVCDNHKSYRVDRLERLLLINLTEVEVAGAEIDTHPEREAVAAAQVRVESLTASHANVMAAIEMGAGLESLVSRLKVIDGDLTMARDGLVQAEAALNRVLAQPKPADGLSDLRDLMGRMDGMTDDDAFPIRAKIHTILKSLLRLYLDAEGDALLVLRHGLGGYLIRADDAVERAASMWPEHQDEIAKRVRLVA